MYSLEILLENAGSPEVFNKDRSQQKSKATGYFFRILHRYLQRFGPHFKDEILDYWFTLDFNNNPEDLALRKQYNFLESKILIPKKWKRNNIHSVDIFQAILKYSQENYDYLSFKAYNQPRSYPMPLVGVDVNIHRKSKLATKFNRENPLLYTDEKSLDWFIKKYSTLRSFSLVVEIPPMSSRIKHPQDKNYTSE